MDSDLSTTAKAMLNRCLFQRTRAAARAVTRLYDHELRSTGFKATQVNVLATVAARGGLSITALSDELGMDRTTLSRNLRPLEQRKLLSVAPEGAHRVRLVTLTPAGETLLTEAAACWERAQSALEASLGGKRVKSVRKSSRALTRSAAKILD